MSYEIELSTRAMARFSSYSLAERQTVVAGLAKLAESPTAVSRRSAPPAELPSFQVYEFWHNSAVLFKILFKYKSDEETLHIHSFGRIEYGN
ncbi:MAG: hypothetical protein IH983_09415 [Planctomycetes bacterium]|nr:hypothetical protein [Planctomycetota bacterium]